MKIGYFGILKRLVCCALVFMLVIGLEPFIITGMAEGEDTGAGNLLSVEAWDFYYDKQFDKALSLFEQEAQEHADWCDAYDGLGWCYLAKGDFMKAEEYFKKSLGIYEYYPNSLAGMAEINVWKYRRFNRAWSYYYAGNFDKAIEIFNEVLQDKTGRLPQEEIWRVNTGLAWSYFTKKDYDKALKCFEEVLKAQNDNADALKGLGLVYLEKQDVEGALKQLRASLKIVPYQPDVQIKIAWIYKDKSDFKRSAAEFEEAKKLNPYLAEPYKGLAWSYFDMGDFEKAKEAFIQGIRVYPGYVADEKFKEVLKKRQDWNDIYLVLGWSYYYYGVYNLAAGEFENALKELSDNAEILRGLGYAYYKLGDYDKAIKNLKESFSKDPNLAPIEEYVTIPGTIAAYLVKSDAQSSLAWALYFKEEYDEAIKEFNEVIERHPDWIDAHDGLGWVYFMIKSYKNAEKAFKDALGFNPSYADAINGLMAINHVKYGKSGSGWSSYYRGDYKTALSEFEDVLKGKDSDFPKDQLWTIHGGIGWCYYREGDFNKAEKEFQLVLNEQGDNIDAMAGLAYALFQKKSYRDAIDSLTKVLEKSPGNYEALTTLGWSYYKTNDFEKAVGAFKDAIAINVYLVDPYLGLALSCYGNGNNDDAKAVLGTAIDIYPDYVMTDEVKKILKKENKWFDLYGRLGWSYYYKGFYDKASETFAEMLKQDTSSEDALLGLGSIYFQQGDYKAAIGKLKPLLSAKPKKEAGWYKWSNVFENLAWSYYYTEDYEKSAEYFMEILTLHIDDDIYAEPYAGLGWCLVKTGDKKGAKTQFLEAIKRIPGYTSALTGLAEVDRMAG